MHVIVNVFNYNIQVIYNRIKASTCDFDGVLSQFYQNVHFLFATKNAKCQLFLYFPWLTVILFSFFLHDLQV